MSLLNTLRRYLALPIIDDIPTHSQVITPHISLVVGDLAGTFVDKYCLGPPMAYVETFRRKKLVLSPQEARYDMGIKKDKQFQILVGKVTDQWEELYGNSPTENDIQSLFQEYQKIQVDILPQYSELLPGVKDTINRLQKSGIKIATTTGYYQNMAEVVIQEMEKQGVTLDAWVAGDMVPHGSRPNPFMLYQCQALLDVPNRENVLKIGDTNADINEGKKAGVWTVGVYRYSNYMNINDLSDENEELIKLNSVLSRDKLAESKPHFIIPDISYLPQVLDNINLTRLSHNITPDHPYDITYLEE